MHCCYRLISHTIFYMFRAIEVCHQVLGTQALLSYLARIYTTRSVARFPNFKAPSLLCIYSILYITYIDESPQCHIHLHIPL